MKKMVLVLLLALAAVAAAKGKKAPQSGPLDGHSFKVVLTSPDAGPAPATLSFAGGQLTAESASGPYTVGKAMHGMTFEAHLKVGKSMITWMGTVDGARIDGSMARAAGKLKTAFTYTGTEDQP